MTGEISGHMLQAIGVKYVIIGHSERRQYFGENEAGVLSKTQAALEYGLTPVVCVGELLAQRESNSTEAVLDAQFQGGAASLTADQFAKIVIAYEPVWAIGTGKVATPEQAAEAHAFIRGRIAAKFGTHQAEATRILYGGSVKPDNFSNRSDDDGRYRWSTGRRREPRPENHLRRPMSTSGVEPVGRAIAPADRLSSRSSRCKGGLPILRQPPQKQLLRINRNPRINLSQSGLHLNTMSSKRNRRSQSLTRLCKTLLLRLNQPLSSPNSRILRPLPLSIAKQPRSILALTRSIQHDSPNHRHLRLLLRRQPSARRHRVTARACAERFS